MIKLSYVLFFASVTAIADVSIPSINDIPLFYTMVGQDPKYQTAACRAQEAFLMQIGVTQKVNMFTSYVNNKATQTVTTFIDKDTPLSSRQVFFVVGTAYAIGVKRQIAKSFRNPMFPSVTHTVSISQEQQTINMQIPF